MPFDVLLLVFSAVFFALVLGLPLIGAGAAVSSALHSVPSGGREPMNRRSAVRGALIALAGLSLLTLGAWLGTEESRMGALESLGILLLTLLGAGLLLTGLGPLPSWLLEVTGPAAERLPAPVRLAARDLVRRRSRAVVAITLAMLTTAFGVGLTVVVVGKTAQSRAEYVARARPGALSVRMNGYFLGSFSGSFSAADVTAVRAAIERELPGVPIVAVERLADDSKHFSVNAAVEFPDEAVYRDQAIGDERLLRYLTGDPLTPYDEDTVVVITSAEVRLDSVNFYHGSKGDKAYEPGPPVPAVVARPAGPPMETVFVPAAMLRDLGYRLLPDELIVDPGVHRVTAGELERLDARLADDLATPYVERGFQAPTGWLPVTAVALLAAVGCALGAGVARAGDARQARVLRRIGDRTGLRWFCAARVGLMAWWGAVLGAVAGCAVGMSLLWPLTMPSGWDDPPRVPFETPWTAIAAIVAGLPLLAAVLGALFAQVRTKKSTK
ncbi:hypothetical protein HII36_22975 [Nonomuraea sp. NN258]|uniref:hypothetical protein n=1 Tax=Nonomuraea antri TaxID=2730852 RepID=UPI0015680125|nr:hypothetical protein [Nonomuraea antri]NRQ34676.1 hypothetical protein [Nonomuraea antri]